MYLHRGGQNYAYATIYNILPNQCTLETGVDYSGYKGVLWFTYMKTTDTAIPLAQVPTGGLAGGDMTKAIYDPRNMFTDAFPESGSNENGSYIKFPDGTLICTKSVTYTNRATSTAKSAVYIVATNFSAGTFAYNFVGSPIITAAINGGNAIDPIWLTAATDTIYWVTCTANVTIPSFTIIYKAEGRWK